MKLNKTFKAFETYQNQNGDFENKITQKSFSDLPEGDLLIKVEYSSLNYKDALSSSGAKGVTKFYPHTPGIDAAGIVIKSNNNHFKTNDRVIVTGFDLGMNTSGGFAEYIQIPSSWAVKCPDSLSTKDSMMLGTAGLTAGLCIEEIYNHTPINNLEVIVSGSTGGVGSIAVMILNKMGYNVTAVTGKDSKADYLKSLGAKSVINRSEFDKDPKLIDKGLWDGVVDTVGGKILANAIVQTNSNGIIAVCGNANTNELNTNVIPFMLRGIKLWGMDSANCSIKRREFIWGEAAKLIDFDLIEKSIQIVSLEELIETYPKILKGEISGRVLVDLNK